MKIKTKIRGGLPRDMIDQYPDDPPPPPPGRGCG